MDAIALKLCDIQGRLFELSARKGYDSAAFVKAFMRSQTAKALDSTYNRMQWAGEEYLLEEVASEAALSTKGEYALSASSTPPQRRHRNPKASLLAAKALRILPPLAIACKSNSFCTAG